MPTSTKSSWFVLVIMVGAAAIAMMMTIDIAIVGEDDKMRNVKGQTIGSRTDPVVVLDGTGKGTITCSNNDNGDNSSSSSSAAQITFKASGYPRGTSADIIGGGTVRLYSTDIGTTRGANITMEGSSGSGSIYSEGFTLQIDRAVVKCPFSAEDASSTSSSAPVESNQSAAYNVGDVLIIGKCGNSVQFFAKDIAEPFQLDGTFRGDVLCISSNIKLTEICPALTGRDSDGDSIDDSCDPTPFLDLDGDGMGDERDEVDNCPSANNPGQSDMDRNGIGDACDLNLPGLMDLDRDSMGDQRGETDNCPYTYNPDQRDIDHDGMGDECDPHSTHAPVYPGQQPIIQSQGPQQSSPDPDRDLDGIPDRADNCVIIRNEDQRDSDRDKKGDVCDNCPNTNNLNQQDRDGDKVGDACDRTPLSDTDRDGIGDQVSETDNCPNIYNPDQADKDRDRIGDVCDPSP